MISRFTFVDEHSLVGVDYVAEEEHEPAPVYEDGFITSIVSGHAHVHHKIEFVNEIEVEGLDDVDTLAEVLDDYFTLLIIKIVCNFIKKPYKVRFFIYFILFVV